MARTARSVHARKKRRKVLEQAKGYRGTKHSSYKRAKEQVWKSGVYAYQGRKQRKRDFRSLWIQRINAGAREHGLSYSQLVHGLDRKSTRLNSSHANISYAVFCLKKKKNNTIILIMKL